MSTIRVGPTLFATNLFWQLTSGPAASAAAARRQAAKLPPEIGTFGHIVVRRTVPRQYGVSSVNNADHRSGMMSAAAALADILEGNWAGLFDVAEGWYFVVCKRGIIHPDSDRLFFRGERELARRALEAALQDDKITAAYAPDDMNIGRASERCAAPLLAKAGRKMSRFFGVNRLAPLDQRAATLRQVMKAVPWVAAGVAALALGPPARELVDLWLTPPSLPGPLRVADPWEDQPPAHAVLRSCVRALLTYPELPGAAMKGAECRPDAVIYHYTPFLRVALPLIRGERAAPGCRLHPDTGSSLLLDCPLAAPARMGRQAALTEEVGGQRLWDAFGALGAALALGPALAIPPRDPQHPEPGPRGRMITVSAKLDLPPDAVAQAAVAIPAFTVAVVTYTAPNLWSFEGTLYVQ